MNTKRRLCHASSPKTCSPESSTGTTPPSGPSFPATSSPTPSRKFPCLPFPGPGEIRTQIHQGRGECGAPPTCLHRTPHIPHCHTTLSPCHFAPSETHFMRSRKTSFPYEYPRSRTCDFCHSAQRLRRFARVVHCLWVLTSSPLSE